MHCFATLTRTSIVALPPPCIKSNHHEINPYLPTWSYPSNHLRLPPPTTRDYLLQPETILTHPKSVPSCPNYPPQPDITSLAPKTTITTQNHCTATDLPTHPGKKKPPPPKNPHHTLENNKPLWISTNHKMEVRFLSLIVVSNGIRPWKLQFHGRIWPIKHQTWPLMMMVRHIDGREKK